MEWWAILLLIVVTVWTLKCLILTTTLSYIGISLVREWRETRVTIDKT